MITLSPKLNIQWLGLQFSKGSPKQPSCINRSISTCTYRHTHTHIGWTHYACACSERLRSWLQSPKWMCSRSIHVVKCITYDRIISECPYGLLASRQSQNQKNTIWKNTRQGKHHKTGTSQKRKFTFVLIAAQRREMDKITIGRDLDNTVEAYFVSCLSSSNYMWVNS